MKMLTNSVITFAMILSIVFLSEAISSTNNPLSVNAQSPTQYQAKNYTKTGSYKKKYVRPTRPYRSYGSGYRVIKVKQYYWAKVQRCRWVSKKVPRCRCSRPSPKTNYSAKKTY
jgi:hypothetical protein